MNFLNDINILRRVTEGKQVIQNRKRMSEKSIYRPEFCDACIPIFRIPEAARNIQTGSDL